MKKITLTIFLSVLFAPVSILAQQGESDLRIFGYFQTLFYYQQQDEPEDKSSSFSLQQLNLFLQKDLATNWRAFVNIEGVNTYNSKRNWGSLRFEEAWARYRDGVKFNLKVGLQIPTFNNFNEIKNRTPLVNYAIRPLVYETSFEEFISVEEYLPTRAFVQAYGFLPRNDFKLDYALYVGNSPNVNGSAAVRQTGVDSTTSLLIGGRLGIRFLGLKAGVSMTRQNIDFYTFAADLYGGPSNLYEDIIQRRLGADFSLDYGRFYLESELISVSYEEINTTANVDKDFYYATIGYDFTDRASLYGSYWFTSEDFQVADFDIGVISVGYSYALNDRTKMKLQYAWVTLEEETSLPTAFVFHNIQKSNVHYWGAALSVFF